MASFYSQLNSVLAGKAWEEPSTTEQWAKVGLGAGATLAGLIFAYSNKAPTFGSDLSTKFQALDDTQKAMFDTVTEDFNAGMTQMGKTMEAHQLGGLSARGITDKGAIAETKASVESSISGARAAAAGALARAKAEAGSRLESTLASYNMQMANKQYEAALTNYQAKMGLFGALGGVAGAIADLADQQHPENVDLETASKDRAKTLEEIPVADTTQAQGLVKRMSQGGTGASMYDIESQDIAQKQRISDLLGGR